MMRRVPYLAVLAIGCALVGCGHKADRGILNQKHALPKSANEVVLAAADGAKVFGHRYLAENSPGRRTVDLDQGKGAPAQSVGEKVILCFHQAGSSAWEYADIAPRFVKNGFDVLAIDQRSGGGTFGHPNLTASALGGNPSYMDAYQDLEAALAWAKKEGYKVLVACGSSYSASLVLKLAADHPDVSAIMCFSPGEYMDEKGIVKGWAQRARQPRFFASTLEEQGKEVKAIFVAGLAPGDRTKDVCMAHEGGVHGASTLLPSKNPTSSETYWAEVDAWLKAVTRE